MNGKTSLPLGTLETGVAMPAARGTVLELLRYFVASAAALGADVGLYRLGLRFGWSYPLAALLGFCVGAVVAYVASVRWVFSARRVRNAGLEFGLFVAIGAGGLLLTELLLWIAIGRLGLPPMWAKLATSAAVFVFNFVARKILLFNSEGIGQPARDTVQSTAERAR